MAVFIAQDIFVTDMGQAAHDFDTPGNGGDTLSIALTTNANKPAVTVETLAGVTEILYTNLNNAAAEGSTLARQPVIAAGTGNTPPGTFTCILEGRTGAASDLVLKAEGGPVATFRHVVHYNLATTPKNLPLIQQYDHGSDVNLNDQETFTIDYNPTLGFFSLT